MWLWDWVSLEVWVARGGFARLFGLRPVASRTDWRASRATEFRALRQGSGGEDIEDAARYKSVEFECQASTGPDHNYDEAAKSCRLHWPSA